MDYNAKKILFITTSMGRGGAERVISILANHYSKNGYDVEIVMLWHSMMEYNLNPNIKVIDFSNDKINPFLRISSNIIKLRKHIKKIKPYVVISFIAQNNIITGIACAGINVRFIPSERNDPSVKSRNYIFKKILDKIYATSTTTVLQTKRAQKFFSSSVRNNSVIISNPIKVQVLALGNYKFRIVSAGRLVSQKNQEMLIRVFSKVHSKYPEYSLSIYGEGELRERLENLINDFNLTDCVELPGNVENIHEKMQDAYMFVLPSNFEGQSNALLEAMMMGLPCISTNCAGSDEIIENGINGLLTEVGDEKQLYNAIVKLINDEPLRNKIAKNAKCSSNAFSFENVINEWDKVILGDDKND